MNWAVGLAAAIAGLAAFWMLLIVLANRLPPGPVRDLAAFLPSCVGLIRALRRDPAVARSAKLALGFAARRIPEPVLLAAWPDPDPRPLLRAIRRRGEPTEWEGVRT